LPLGTSDVKSVVERIRQSDATMVLNTVNGDTNIALLRALRATGIRSDAVPLLSFSLDQTGYRDLDPSLVAGDYLAWNYFEGFESQENRQFLEALHERSPADRPQVTHITSGEQVARLRSGELDVGIFNDDGEEEGLEEEPLFPGEPLVAFLAPDHPLTEHAVLGPADLAQETLVVFPQAARVAPHDRWLALLERAGYRFAGVRDAGGPDPRDLLLAVAGRLGVMLAPASLAAVSDAGALVVRRELDPQVTLANTVVAWRADPPERLRETLAVVRDIARELRAAAGEP